MSDDHVALVIGNGRYENVPNLKNAVRDAELIGAALEKLRFKTTILRDIATTGELITALIAFKDAVSKSKVAVFYFAGHGFYANGQNYLMSTCSSGLFDYLDTAGNLEFTKVLYVLQEAEKRGVFFLDCCRTRLAGDEAEAFNKKGTYVHPKVYGISSTRALMPASDNSANPKHGPFALELSKLLTPSASLSYVMQQLTIARIGQIPEWWGGSQDFHMNEDLYGAHEVEVLLGSIGSLSRKDQRRRLGIALRAEKKYNGHIARGLLVDALQRTGESPTSSVIVDAVLEDAGGRIDYSTITDHSEISDTSSEISRSTATQSLPTKLPIVDRVDRVDKEKTNVIGDAPIISDLDAHSYLPLFESVESHSKALSRLSIIGSLTSLLRPSREKRSKATFFYPAVKRELARLQLLSVEELQREVSALRYLAMNEQLSYDATILISITQAIEGFKRSGLGEPTRHQIIAACEIASGAIVDMPSGSGKSISAFLAAVAFSAIHRNCGVYYSSITLSRRDFERFKPISNALGLKTVILEGDTSTDDLQSASLLFGDIQTATLAFLQQQTGPLPFHVMPMSAVFHQADILLNDNAFTPTIISSPIEIIDDAYDIVGEFLHGLHHDDITRQADGATWLSERALDELSTKLRQEGLISTSLPATRNATPNIDAARLHHIICATIDVSMMRRGIHFEVIDGQVVPLDTLTSEPLTNNLFLRGWQQALESRLGLELSAELITVNKIYRHAFVEAHCCYGALSAQAAQDERLFRKLYGKAVVRSARPSRNPISIDKDLFLRNSFVRADVILDFCSQSTQSGRPLIIVVYDRPQAIAVSSLLSKNNYAHYSLLTSGEYTAAALTKAGMKNSITVALAPLIKGHKISLSGASIDDTNTLRTMGGLWLVVVGRSVVRRHDDHLLDIFAKEDPGRASFILTYEDTIFGQIGVRMERFIQAVGLADSIDVAQSNPLLDAKVSNLQARFADSRAKLFDQFLPMRQAWERNRWNAREYIRIAAKNTDEEVKEFYRNLTHSVVATIIEKGINLEMNDVEQNKAISDSFHSIFGNDLGFQRVAENSDVEFAISETSTMALAIIEPSINLDHPDIAALRHMALQCLADYWSQVVQYEESNLHPSDASQAVRYIGALDVLMNQYLFAVAVAALKACLNRMPSKIADGH